jgi:hypothetical protein
MRFEPSQLVVSKELEWVMGRAFGAIAMRLICPGPREAVVLANSLGLGPRIVTRNSRAILEEELGAAEVRSLLAALGVALLGNETLLRTTREVADAAAKLGSPIVVLKGMALHLTGRSPLGARWASDVDVLVAEAQLASLASALEERGYQAHTGGPACDHQLPDFQRGPGENVDVHRFLPGVRLPGRRGFADLDSLEAAGLLEPLPMLAGRSFSPAASVLAAHALVHGIAQHGFAPQSYPLMRMVCDLADLGVGTPPASTMWTRATALTEGHVRTDEAAATWDLCERLVSGAALPPVLPRGGDGADILLGHILAGALDPVYRDSLRLRVFGSTPSVLPWPLPWARDVARSLWPTDSHLRALSGSKAPRFGALGARVSRPIVQVGRAMRSGWSAVRARRRQAHRTAVESSPKRP